MFRSVARLRRIAAGHIGETTFHQDDIRRIDSDICSGSDGDTDVGSRKCRSVVDAVSHHGYPAFFLQFTDDGFLAIRQNACHHFIHTGLFSDGPAVRSLSPVSITTWMPIFFSS